MKTLSSEAFNAPVQSESLDVLQPNLLSVSCKKTESLDFLQPNVQSTLSYKNYQFAKNN
jgi:hypothetical protein